MSRSLFKHSIKTNWVTFLGVFIAVVASPIKNLIIYADQNNCVEVSWLNFVMIGVLAAFFVTLLFVLLDLCIRFNSGYIRLKLFIEWILIAFLLVGVSEMFIGRRISILIVETLFVTQWIRSRILKTYSEWLAN